MPTGLARLGNALRAVKNMLNRRFHGGIRPPVHFNANLDRRFQPGIRDFPDFIIIRMGARIADLMPTICKASAIQIYFASRSALCLAWHSALHPAFYLALYLAFCFALHSASPSIIRLARHIAFCVWIASCVLHGVSCFAFHSTLHSMFPCIPLCIRSYVLCRIFYPAFCLLFYIAFYVAIYSMLSLRVHSEIPNVILARSFYWAGQLASLQGKCVASAFKTGWTPQTDRLACESSE